MRVSIHFTPKGQDVQELIKKTKDAINVLKATGEPLQIYHAFLTEKHCKTMGLPLDIVKMFNGFVDDTTTVHEFNEDKYDAFKARMKVYNSLKESKNNECRFALFVGEVKEGVLEEYAELHSHLNIRLVHIQ